MKCLTLDMTVHFILLANIIKTLGTARKVLGMGFTRCTRPPATRSYLIIGVKGTLGQGKRPTWFLGTIGPVQKRTLESMYVWVYILRIVLSPVGNRISNFVELFVRFYFICLGLDFARLRLHPAEDTDAAAVVSSSKVGAVDVAELRGRPCDAFID